MKGPIGRMSLVLWICIFFFLQCRNLFADETCELILKLLIKKGIVTQQEVNKLRAELERKKSLEAQPPEAKLPEALIPGYAKEGKIKFKGYVQARFTYNEEGEDTFRVPGAYLTAYGEVLPGWAYEIEANVAGSAPHLRNGYIRWTRFHQSFASLSGSLNHLLPKSI